MAYLSRMVEYCWIRSQLGVGIGERGPGSSELSVMYHPPGDPLSLISSPRTLWSSDLPATH